MRKLLFGIPLGLAAALLVFDSMLVRLVLPYRELVVVLLLTQLAIAITMFWRRRMIGHVRLPVVLAGIVVILLAVTYRREYAGHSEQRVSFQSDGASLVGTLYTPNTAGPHPAIILVHGSGKFPRRMYRYWAKNLVDIGFVVLAYDKRGVGDSGGKYEGENNTSDENIRQLARDASAAVNEVAARKDVSRHVGLMGISQGGWIAPLAASFNPHVRFLILHSGPTVSVHEENFYSRLTGDGHGKSAIPLEEAARKTELESPSGFDPRLVLGKLDVTGLWLFGSADASIPVSKSVAVLQQEVGRGQAYEFHIFPSANHLLLTRTGLLPDVAKGYWPAIIEWSGRMKDRPLTAREN